MIDKKTGVKIWNEISIQQGEMFEGKDITEKELLINTKNWISEESLIEQGSIWIKHFESIGATKEAKAIVVFIRSITKELKGVKE